MDSGSFWLESYATGSGFGRFSGDKEKSLYCLYEFTYYDLTEEEIREMKAALAAKIAEITALVSADADIWEKARLVHDELIRRVLPKGSSFDNLTQADISRMMDHINSYKRKKLNDRSPYETFSFHYGEEVLKLLGCTPVAAEDILLKPTLLK